MTAILLLMLAACKPDHSNSEPPKIDVTQLKQEYLQLQKNHQELQTRLIKLQQENAALKAEPAAASSRDKDIENQLRQTQKSLTHQQREYQILQQDYADLKNSISPLAARLQEVVNAHRSELIGTELGTVTLKNERQLHQVKITEITDDSLKLKFSDGWINVPYEELPPPIQRRLFFKNVQVSPKALLSKNSDVSKTPPVPKTTKQKNPSPVEEAFAERHRLELAQYRQSIPLKITLLKNKISTAKNKIQTLKRERSKTTQQFSRRSGSIKRSRVDLDKALNKIDGEIRKIELAIQVAEVRIKSWQKELNQAESSVK